MNPYHIVSRYFSRLPALDRLLYARRLPHSDRFLFAAGLLRNGVTLGSVQAMLALAAS